MLNKLNLTKFQEMKELSNIFSRFISDFTSQTAITHCQSKHFLSRFIAICNEQTRSTLEITYAT